MPDHPLLDRVVRGRAWIAVLGVMLAGIVAMQIEVLKLGASIGRSVQRGTSLQSRNEQLQASVASLGDDQRIERMAATMGMVMPAPGGVGFVSVGPATVQKAIANIHQPNTAVFLAQPDPNGAVTGASNTGASTASGEDTTGTVPGAGTTGATGTASAGVPTTGTGTASSTGVSSPSTSTAPAAPSAPLTTTQPATPASTVPAETTSPASAATGAAGTAAIAPTQSSSPTAGSGGAGVPAAG